MRASWIGRAALMGAMAVMTVTVAMAAGAATEPDMAAARKAVYGGPTWMEKGDLRGAGFFGNGARLEVNEVFRARYREQEQEKLILIYQLTPGPREQFRCHGCVPALGGAVMVEEAGEGGRGWRVQARGLLLMAGAPYSGPEDLQLIRLGQERWALRSRQYDMSGGLESRRERLLMQQQDRLVLVLDEGFADKPGPSACGPGAAEQSSALQPVSGSEAAPRLELVLRYNEGACPTPTATVERRRFQLRDGRFLPD